MLTEIITKIVINIVLIVVTVVTGFILHKAGKPYNNLLFTLHKLTTIAFVILSVIVMIAFSKQVGLNSLFISMMILSALSVIGLLASGGAMSLDKSQAVMLTIHQVSVGLFLISTSVLVYTILYAVKH